MNQKSRNENRGLTLKILIGLIGGVLLGVLLKFVGDSPVLQTFVTDGVLKIIGDIYVSSLKMMVVPLVFVSLVCGAASMDNARKLGRISAKTLGLYLATTAIAITLGISAAMIFQPGEGFPQTIDTGYEANPTPPISETLINIVPSNPFESMATGNILQVIFFALFFGFALNLMSAHSPEGSGSRVLTGFKAVNDILLRMVLILVRFAPIGVFALIARVFAAQGFEAIIPLSKYFFVVLGVLAIHLLGFYPVLLGAFSNLNPSVFFNKFKRAILFAFSTASSNATIPISLDVVENRMGVKSHISSFTVPLGATINMDGTAIMQGVATVFISQAYGISLGTGQYLLVILVATLASIGTAGIPAAGLIMLTMVLQQVGLPVDAIGLILGVDRLLDMCRTAVNVTGDAIVTCIVASSENALDTNVFESEEDDALSRFLEKKRG